MGWHWNIFPFNVKPQVEMTAVKENAWAIAFIESPSRDLQIQAITGPSYNATWSTIGYIDNPLPEVQMLAVQKNLKAMDYIQNPTQEVLEYVRSNR